MPFDPSGNFTRDYNWVDDKNNGIKITASRMDGEFNNFATAMNQTFLRNGVVPMTGPLLMNANNVTGLANGTAGAPAVQFNSDPTTGWYASGVGKLSISAAGVQRLEAHGTGVSVFGTLSASGLGKFTQPNSPLGGVSIVSDAAASARVVFYMPDGVTVNGIILSDISDGSLRFLAGNTVPFQLNISSAGVISDKNNNELGYKDVPQVLFAVGYNPTLGDRGKHIMTNNSSSFGILANSVVAFPIGTVFTVINNGGVNSSLVGDVGVTLKLAGTGATGNKTLAPGAMATCLKVDTNTWYVGGPGVT